MQGSIFQFRQIATSRFVNRVVLFIGTITFLAPIVDFFTFSLFYTIGPIELLTLSSEKIREGYLWQFLTYPLILQTTHNFSLTFLSLLSLSLFLLWVLANHVHSQCKRRFFLLTFCGGILFPSLTVFLIFSSFQLVSLFPLLFALASFLLFSQKKKKIPLFLLYSLPIRHLYLLLGVSIGLTSFFYRSWPLLTAEIAGVAWGYGLSFVRKKMQARRPEVLLETPLSNSQNSKEALVNFLLEKILAKGMHSLSPSERALLDREAKKRKHIEGIT